MGVSRCSAQSKKRRTSNRLPLRRPRARSCQAKKLSGLAARSSGALFQQVDSELLGCHRAAGGLAHARGDSRRASEGLVAVDVHAEADVPAARGALRCRLARLEPKVLAARPDRGRGCGGLSEGADRALHLEELRLEVLHQLAKLALEGIAFRDSVGLVHDELRAEGRHDGVELGDRLAAELRHLLGALLDQDEAVAYRLQLGALHQDGAAKLGDGGLKDAAPHVHLGCEARKIGRVEDVEGLLE